MSTQLYKVLEKIARNPQAKKDFATLKLGNRLFKSDLIPNIRNEPIAKITTLENGLRIATETSNRPISSLGVFIDSGSASENESNNGTSNFIQRLSLSGTQSRSQSQIVHEIESLGGELNAHTSREIMSYIGRTVNKSNVPKMFEVMSDIIQNPKFDLNDINIARSKILKEKSLVDSNFEEVIMDFIHTAAFQGFPLSLPIIGSTDSIQSIQRENLLEFVKSRFVTTNMVISANGQFEHEEIVELAQKHFNSLPTESKIDISNISEIDYIGSEITVNDNTMKKVYGAIAFEGPSWSNPDFVPFLLIKDFIGSWNKHVGGGNSLVPNLSEISFDRDLCESYSSFLLPYNMTGLFGIYYVTSYSCADDFGRILMEELSRVKGMTQRELDIAKMRVRSSYLLEVDRQDPVEELGRQVLTIGRKMTSFEFLKRLDDITLKDIKGVYNTYLHDVDPVVAAYGNLKYYPDYNNFRSWTT